MKLQLFLKEVDLISEHDLREKLEHREKGVFGAFWLIDNEPTMSLFINNENACLYYMPGTEEDKWSFNPEFKGNEDDTIDFLIENYQLDEISKTTVIPTKQAIDAFVYFYNTKKLSTAITWN